MGRAFQIAGQCLVQVTRQGQSQQDLGLSDGPISVAPKLQHLDIHVDAYGDSVPNQQFMGGEAIVSFTLVHFDASVLQSLIADSMASGTEGTLPNAGTLMGADLPGSNSTFYFSLNITSPVSNLPWVFPSCYLADTPVTWPLGAERSVAQINVRAVPYKSDPQSSTGTVLWHH